jgi:hypothetical protein
MDITDLFTDKRLVSKIQTRLPQLFHLAELESSRAGKVGMEVGSVREKILIAVLIHKFGRANVETDIPIAEAEVDVRLFDKPVSIKTVTSKKLGGVKIIWTVDPQQALKFSHDYVPTCDVLLAQVNWADTGGLFLFPNIAQFDVLEQIGRQRYIKLPKPGTNPRGVEISAEALSLLSKHSQSRAIPIQWHKLVVEYDPYDRWLDLWERA